MKKLGLFASTLLVACSSPLKPIEISLSENANVATAAAQTSSSTHAEKQPHRKVQLNSLPPVSEEYKSVKAKEYFLKHKHIVNAFEEIKQIFQKGISNNTNPFFSCSDKEFYNKDSSQVDAMRGRICLDKYSIDGMMGQRMWNKYWITESERFDFLKQFRKNELDKSSLSLFIEIEHH